MKIAIYYTRPFEVGGVEKTMLERGKVLKKAGHEITFVFNSKDSPLDMLEKWAKVGNVIRFDCCREHFDVCIYDAVYNLQKVDADRYIQVINGCLIDSNENYEEVIPFNEYVAVSEEASIQFLQRKGKKCKIIPNLINQEEIRELAKEKVDIPKKKHNFLVVSRIDEQKGFERIDKLLKKWQEEYQDDYQLVVVGSCYLYPGYSKKLKERWKNYNVIWEGKQDNPYKYMKWADVLFQLSDYESQCMVMYEALVLGTPCVCTDFPNAVKELTEGKGIVLKKDLSNVDLKAIEELKKGFEYNYPDYGKDWLEVIKRPPKKDIRFSIVIPNYNNSEWLEKCLNSVLNQTYKNYEIIFVDDMSTDNSLEIARKMLKDHKVIQLNQKRLNGGARNVGILEASGDYILCVDSDDWLKNDNILKMLNEKIYDEDVIFLGFDLFDGEKEDLFPFVPKYDNLYDAFVNDVCAIWTKVVKTDILKNTLFPEGTLAEDRVHHYRIIDKSTTFLTILTSTHVWNRANKHSVTTARNVEWEASIYRHLGEMYKFIHTTTNEKYRKYVEEKFRRQWNELANRRYQQI